MIKKLLHTIRYSKVMKALHRQEGFTLLEVGVSMVVTTLMIAPVGAILWQITVVPADTSASLIGDSQVRAVDIGISDDFRSTQIVAAEDEPVWASSEWTDFTVPSGDYHTLRYVWEATEATMVRESTVNGAPGPAFAMGRFFDQFENAKIGFKPNLPPFVVETAASVELDTPLGTQVRTGSMITFLRAPIGPSPQVGGYAVFSTAGIKLSGNNNAIIGNVHANEEIRISCLRDHIAGFVDTPEGISLRPAHCLYLHNFPTPPDCDSPSFYDGFFDLSPNPPKDGLGDSP